MLSTLLKKTRKKARPLKTGLRILRSLVRNAVNTLRTSMKKFTGASDHHRWSDETELLVAWDSRTQKIAALVEPGASVIEFGAGRLVLKKFLPASCSYTPSDLVDRDGKTLICDLNAYELAPFPPHDVAVFSGVLEYVHDVPRLISHLSNCVGVIIASYAVTDFSKINRRGSGWVNDFSSENILQIFDAFGFSCNYREVWECQEIYRFTKR